MANLHGTPENLVQPRGAEPLQHIVALSPFKIALAVFVVLLLIVLAVWLNPFHTVPRRRRHRRWSGSAPWPIASGLSRRR